MHTWSMLWLHWLVATSASAQPVTTLVSLQTIEPLRHIASQARHWREGGHKHECRSLAAQRQQGS